MLPGSSTSLTALFHGCGSQFKTTGMCSRSARGVSVRSATPAERYQIYTVPSAKRNMVQLTVLSRWQISFLPPQESRSRKTVARRLRGVETMHARRPVAVCVPLTRQHRYCPFAMASEHHNRLEQTGVRTYSQMMSRSQSVIGS
ncbi:hypothetical protein TNCV_2877611 [Trichonephila clavipes]|nr:hypothetical protein TNCV_2877611 [Trichonephila clavipes]